MNKNIFNKNAIVMLLMLNDAYLNGAIVSSIAHRKLMELSNIKYDLVIMCDKKIYDVYNTVLNKYFDKVYLIDLIHYEIDTKKYKFAEKYSKWIGYSINKLHCMKLVEYEKVLFVDIDILPINKKFYDVFKYDTPAFHEIKLEKNKDSYNSYEKFIENKRININKINAGLFLIKPSTNDYQKYMNFVNKIYQDGIYSVYYSGPDETSLYYFYRYIKKDKISVIPPNYTIIPWKQTSQNALSINYLSLIKPWRKPKILMWKEEYIWYNILNSITSSNKNNKIFIVRIRDYLYCYYFYINNWTKYREGDKPFNEENINNIDKELINKLKQDRELDKYVNSDIIDYGNSRMIEKIMSYKYILDVK